MTKPYLNTSSPRLTNLDGIRRPDTCQKCGATGPAARVKGFVEHDHHDQPEARVVFLCAPCAHRLIEPHPRLYRQLAQHEPFPGAMPLCMDCQHRDGAGCTHQRARSNGGAGLEIRFPQPARAMVDGRNYRGPLTIFTGPVTSCDGKEASA